MSSSSAPSFNPNTLENQTFHFVGIGGCGMSGLARLITRLGATVQGTDLVESEVTQGLIKEGISVSYEQDGQTIHTQIDVIVHSAAIPPDHIEILKGDEYGIPVLTYAKNAWICSI